jgi:hypothetical protein
MNGDVGVLIHVFLNSALILGEWSASCPGGFILGKRAPGTRCIGDWLGPKTDLDDVEMRKILPLPGPELRSLGRPSHSQPIYRLSYPGSYQYVENIFVSLLLA